MLATENISNRLTEITCPTLIVHGTNDPAVSIESAREMATKFCGLVELVEIANARHSAILTHNDHVAAAIETFIKRSNNFRFSEPFPRKIASHICSIDTPNNIVSQQSEKHVSLHWNAHPHWPWRSFMQQHQQFLTIRRVVTASVVTLSALTISILTNPFTATAEAKPAKSVSLTAATKTVKTDRITMAYRQFGRGPDMVLVTGFSCTMDDWDPILLDKLAKTHRITVFNHDGVGGTQASGVKDLTAHTLAEDMSSLITNLKLKRPDIVAISLGAIVTQDFAINHPAQLNRLVLGGSATSGPAFVPPGPEIFAALQDVESPVHDIWKYFFTAENQNRIAPWIARTKQRTDYHEMTIPESLPMRAVLSAFLQTPTPQNLEAIQARTLVAVGANDIVTLPANSKYIADHIPGAQLITYTGAGHAFSEQYAQRFAADINTFLKKR